MALAAFTACKSKTSPVDGIGPWHIGKSTVSEGTICRQLEDGTTYCSHNAEMTIAEHRASVDLYFRGQEETSTLNEILLALGACNVQAVDGWLTRKLGAAPAHRGKVPVWPGKAATVVALLPSRDGVCQIHFVDPGDEKRLAQLEAESVPARAAP